MIFPLFFNKHVFLTSYYMFFLFLVNHLLTLWKCLCFLENPWQRLIPLSWSRERWQRSLLVFSNKMMINIILLRVQLFQHNSSPNVLKCVFRLPDSSCRHTLKQTCQTVLVYVLSIWKVQEWELVFKRSMFIAWFHLICNVHT